MSSVDIHKVSNPLPYEPHLSSSFAGGSLGDSIRAKRKGKDIEKGEDTVSELSASASSSLIERRLVTLLLENAKNPLVRRLIGVALLFAASETYPFLGMAILRGRVPEHARDVATAVAIGSSIVAALYVLVAVLARIAAPGWVLNQPRLVILVVEVAACLVAGCFVPILGVGLYHPGIRTGSGELRELVLDVLVVSVIGMFVAVLSPVVLLPLVGAWAVLSAPEER